VNLTGLTWLLLQSLGLGVEAWDRLLAPLGGQMPQNDVEFGALCERIRRLFHLNEVECNILEHREQWVMLAIFM